MVPASLRRSLRTKSLDSVLNSVPPKFTLGKGHVTFFYDKIGFLKTRFERLCEEMVLRGYTCDRTRGTAFEGFPDVFNGGWVADELDNSVVQARINFRISQKPHLYE